MADHATPAAGASALTVRIVTPDAMVFDGRAEVVVVPSHDGETAFLKGHAAFVGLLGSGELRFETPAGTQHHYLQGGVVQVVDDVVTVLAESVIAVALLDPAKAQAELAAAQRLPVATNDQLEARDRVLFAARVKLRLASRGGAAAAH